MLCEKKPRVFLSLLRDHWQVKFKWVCGQVAVGQALKESELIFGWYQESGIYIQGNFKAAQLEEIKHTEAAK